MRPCVGISRKLMHLRKVLLPEPEAPIIETTSPSCAVSDTPLRTSRSPKLLCNPSTTTAGCPFELPLLTWRVLPCFVLVVQELITQSKNWSIRHRRGCRQSLCPVLRRAVNARAFEHVLLSPLPFLKETS